MSELREGLIPSETRLSRGRVAVTLCGGVDGCGRCAEACGFGAIRKNGCLPVVFHDECIGCGACVSACPQGRMRLVDFTKGAGRVELTLKLCLPEPCPVPPSGTTLALKGRGGEEYKAEVLQALPAGGGAIVRVSSEGTAAFIELSL